MRYGLKLPKRFWVGSVVMLSSEEVTNLRGVIVDVVYSSSSLAITHAVVAIDLGSDFPTLYQPIRVGLLCSLTHPERNTFVVRASSAAITETLPDFMEYEINVRTVDSPAPAPYPQSCRTH